MQRDTLPSGFSAIIMKHTETQKVELVEEKLSRILLDRISSQKNV